MKTDIRISAVGDIAFVGRNADQPSLETFSAVSDLFKKSDLVVGNLESPLIIDGQPITGKCTLRGNTGWADIMRRAGIHVVSLANNHLMDYGEDGLISTFEALDGANIRYVGAGRNAEEALRPLFLEVASKKIALLARTSVIVSSPSYADEWKAGVAYFNLDETIQIIQQYRQKSEFVILLMHWGMEEYRYPSSKQRELARQLVTAGADAVIGHHPHVLQGVERIGKSIIAYSLGNFIFDEFAWTFVGRDGKIHDQVVELSERNRQSGVLEIFLQQKGVLSHEFHPTWIETGGTVRSDDSPDRRIDFDRLTTRLGWPAYAVFWRFYSLMREWDLRMKPLIKGKLTLAKLKKLRIRHFKELFDTARRSSKVMSGKSTNPYE